MPTNKPKPDLVKAADDFARKYEDVFGDEDPQDIINELRGDGDVPGASMNSSGESAAREQWIPCSERLPELFKDPSEVNVKLRDGSILCGAIHQTDGDWWWRERFFDASEITHWSVAAQGEQHD